VSLHRIDAMTEATIEALSRPSGAGDLVRMLSAQWPDAPGLEAAFALGSAGVALEELFQSSVPGPSPSEMAFRAAALLAADLYTLSSLGISAPTLRDVDALSRRVPR